MSAASSHDLGGYFTNRHGFAGPNKPNVYTSAPAAMGTYCFPSISKVIGEAVNRCQSGSATSAYPIERRRLPGFRRHRRRTRLRPRQTRFRPTSFLVQPWDIPIRVCLLCSRFVRQVELPWLFLESARLRLQKPTIVSAFAVVVVYMSHRSSVGTYSNFVCGLNEGDVQFDAPRTAG